MEHAPLLTEQQKKDLRFIRDNGFNITRNDYVADRWHVVNRKGKKLGLYTEAEAIRMAVSAVNLYLKYNLK